MTQHGNGVSRRTFVGTVTGAAVVGLAGCSGGGGGQPTDTPTGTATPTPGMETPTPEGGYRNGVGPDASVAFAVPADGAALTSTSVAWRASADGVSIEPAGEVTRGAGHYHLLIDTEAVTPGDLIPADAAHVHYGTGQSEGVLELEAGTHTLTLQVGDGGHTAMALTNAVEVTVGDSAALALETSVEGSVVTWSVTATDYTIEPASAGVNSDAGHLHAIIDAEPVAVGAIVPGDSTHIHYGDGSTSGRIDLAEALGDDYAAGEHRLVLQVGTGTHRATGVYVETTVTTA